VEFVRPLVSGTHWTCSACSVQLAAEVPPAVLADLLGLHIGTAVRWATEAGGDWINYAAIRATADTDHQPAARAHRETGTPGDCCGADLLTGRIQLAEGASRNG
jgi:hypothetical protein